MTQPAGAAQTARQQDPLQLPFLRLPSLTSSLCIASQLRLLAPPWTVRHRSCHSTCLTLSHHDRVCGLFALLLLLRLSLRLWLCAGRAADETLRGGRGLLLDPVQLVEASDSPSKCHQKQGDPRIASVCFSHVTVHHVGLSGVPSFSFFPGTSSSEQRCVHVPPLSSWRALAPLSLACCMPVQGTEM